ncbi:MAG TPA: GntR family transcriptional regulator [Atribacteraceae bacterium]|nr:GntR family transcriptional regulator [Atribacteraceae bacterium]
MSRHDYAVDQIRLYVVEASLKAGDMLPTEKALEQLLNLSRTSIREALRSMEARGIVETRQGVGRFLRSYNYDGFVDNLSYNLEVNTRRFKDVIDVRIALELQFLELLVPKYDENDLRLIDANLEKLGASFFQGGPEESLIHSHADFHVGLYQRADNQLLTHLIRMFASFQRNLALRKQYPAMGTADFFSLHEALVQAIKRRELYLVRARLIDHFRDVLEWTKATES